MNDMFAIEPIGQIHSPHKNPKETPIQPVFASGIRGTVTVDDAYADGLLDLDGFSHVYLLYRFHRAEQVKLRVRPYLQDEERGVFATRAPFRPNHIGFSVVRLLSIEGTTLHVEDLDVLDGTPLLDIKPFIARFDLRDNVCSGWQEEVGDDMARRRGVRDYMGNGQ
jgi:tRNA-Thr(GGU) m(6)t(6)A37 methyltransferase TsaA